MSGLQFFRRLLARSSAPERRIDEDRALQVWPGIAGSGGVYLIGRVARRQAIEDIEVWRRTWLAHLPALLRRGIAGVDLEISYENETYRVESGDNGYFTVHRRRPLPARPSSEMAIRLDGSDELVSVRPWTNLDRLIISDIDDTVLETGAANKWRMFANLLFRPTDRQKLFDDVADFYHELCRDAPLIMVSRGPWAIYGTLDLIFDMHDMPAERALFLRDWGLRWRPPFYRSSMDYKRKVIRSILQITPEARCVLIGDSGESDTEIYLEIAEDFGERIEAVFIRDVSNARRNAVVRELGSRLHDRGIPFCLGADTREFQQFARQHGIITAPSVKARSADLCP